MKIGYFLSPYDDIQSIFGSVPTLQDRYPRLAKPLVEHRLRRQHTDTGAFDDRVANSIRYDSPNIAGFTGSVQVGGRDTGGSDGGTLAQQRRHAYVISTGGQYNNGPSGAGLAYEVHNNLRDGTAANPHLQDQAGTVAGSWNFGIVKVGAAYE